MTEIKSTVEQIVVDSDIKTAYDNQYSNTLSEWRMLGAKYKVQNIVQLCKRQNMQFANLLEVGAGEGSILQHLQDRNFCDAMEAVEISRSGVDAIKERQLSSVKAVKLFDGYQLPYEDETFDLVILSHVLEHVEFPRTLLREIWRVSKNLIIEVPCDYSPTVDQKFDHYMSYGHINIYNPPIIRYLLQSEGFTILDDLSTRIAPEVAEYIKFVLGKRPKTPFVVQKLRGYLRYRDWLFNRFGRQGREKRGEAYTALCRKTDRPSIF